MKYKNLGMRGPKVSTVGFGAWAIGGMNWGKTEEQVIENSSASDLGIIPEAFIPILD